MAAVNQVGNALTGSTGTGLFVGATSPTITTPRIGTINDTNGVPILVLSPVASAVNYVAINNNILGGSVFVFADGSDTNIPIALASKGSSPVTLQGARGGNIPVIFYNGTTLQHATSFSFSNTAASRTVTFPDADGTVLFAAGSGGLKSFQVLTSGTAATYTTPAGITSILVEVWGGGGGGGGVAGTASSLSAAGGGGAGGYARLWVSSASASYTYTIGGGGNGGTAGNNSGSSGGTTTFSGSSLQATGGGGGAGSAGFLTTTAGFTSVAAGGTGSNGIMNSAGDPGVAGTSVLGSGLSGSGGSSAFGAGGVGLRSNAGGSSATGTNGNAYASGGGGGITGATPDRAGGNGSAGLIVVWEFA